jgi:tetratricopeptide repeat protein
VRGRSLVALLWATPLLAQPATPAPTTQTTQADKEQAQRYLDAGNALFESGDTENALVNFKEAYRLYPSPKLLINIAAAYRKLGRPVEALEAYEKFVSEAPQVSRDRVDSARRSAKELEAEVGRIVVTAPAGTEVALDGETKGKVPLGLLRAMAGTRKVTLTPPDGVPVVVVVDVVGGSTHTVRPEDGTPLVAAQAPAPAPGPIATGPSTLSHRGRLGANVRADIEGHGDGAVGNVGIAYGLGDRVEVDLAGLIGEHGGVRPGAALFLMTGAYKPLLYVGVPIFFADGATKAGVHGGAGLMWDPTPRIGVFAGLGVAYHPGVPEPLDKTVFLPTLGVQGRM